MVKEDKSLPLFSTRHLIAQTGQNENFQPNCNCRGSNAPPACPKAVEGATTRLLVAPLAPGSSKFVRLNRLNDSARNCTLTRSVMWKFLIIDISTPKLFGPRKVFRPKLPTQPGHGRVKNPT